VKANGLKEASIEFAFFASKQKTIIFLIKKNYKFGLHLRAPIQAFAQSSWLFHCLLSIKSTRHQN